MDTSIDIVRFLKEEHAILLTPSQQTVLPQIDGTTLLLAVPGAGKTTVMVARIAYMIAVKQIAPSSILTLTFSRASAKDMAARFHTLFSALCPLPPAFSTIHAFCYGVIQSYCRHKNTTPPTLLEGSREYSRMSLLQHCYQSIHQEMLAEDTGEELSAAVSCVKNRQLTKEEISLYSCGISRFSEIFQQYEATKRQHNLMDFDDMLGYTYHILKRHPAVLEKYQSRYPYILVDEVQDTSVLQHRIIHLLSQKTGNLFMVGDEDQSIYAFRGAQPDELLNFSRTFPLGTILKIEENFRSSPQIVAAANRFISQNKNRHPKEMFTQNPSGEDIQKIVVSKPLEQYEKAVSLLMQPFSGTTAVIYRNNNSAIPLIDLFARKGIPCTIRNHSSSFRRSFVVMDMLAFFALSRDPTDVKAFSRVFFKTNCYLKRSLLKSIVAKADGKTSLWELAISLQEEDGNTGRVRYVSSMLLSLSKLSPKRAIDLICDSLGYLDFLSYCTGSQLYQSHLQKLDALRFLAMQTTSLPELEGRLHSLDQLIHTASLLESCPLTLTTAHAAKGLEFDRVILLDVIDGIFPSTALAEEDKAKRQDRIEEEARLFYVAVTRAKSQLVLMEVQNTNTPPSSFYQRLLFPCVGSGFSPEKEIVPGRRIVHRYFGDGQITRVAPEKKQFTAYFGEHGNRILVFDSFKEKIVTFKE